MDRQGNIVDSNGQYELLPSMSGRGYDVVQQDNLKEIQASPQRMTPMLYDVQVSPNRMNPQGLLVSPEEQQALRELPLEQISMKPSMTQKSDRFVGPLAPEEPQSLGQRARGLLSGIGNLMGVGQPDFRDRLVIGLGSMTMQPNNPLTQQAMANIQSRRQESATLEEFQREAQLQRELQEQRLLSAEVIAQRELDAELAALQAEPTSFQEKMGDLYATQLVDFNQGGAASLNDIQVVNDVMNTLTQRIEAGDTKNFGERLLGAFQTSTNPFIRTVIASYNEEEISMTQAIQQVVSKSLKDTLGAQFGQIENINYTNRAYDPALSDEDNLRKLQVLQSGLMAAYQANLDLKRYSDEGGDLNLYTGPRAVDAFNQVIDAEVSGINQGQDIFTPDALTEVPSWFTG